MLTAQDIADRFGVQVKAVYDWRRMGQLPQAHCADPDTHPRFYWTQDQIDEWAKTPQARQRLAIYFRRAQSWQKRRGGDA